MSNRTGRLPPAGDAGTMPERCQKRCLGRRSPGIIAMHIIARGGGGGWGPAHPLPRSPLQPAPAALLAPTWISSAWFWSSITWMRKVLLAATVATPAAAGAPAAEAGTHWKESKRKPWPSAAAAASAMALGRRWAVASLQKAWRSASLAAAGAGGGASAANARAASSSADSAMRRPGAIGSARTLIEVMWRPASRKHPINVTHFPPAEDPTWRRSGSAGRAPTSSSPQADLGGLATRAVQLAAQSGSPGWPGCYISANR